MNNRRHTSMMILDDYMPDDQAKNRAVKWTPMHKRSTSICNVNDSASRRFPPIKREYSKSTSKKLNRN